MTRKRPEWIGKTDDSKPTRAVRQRIYDKTQGACYLCEMPFDGKRWEADHKVPLWKGGENRESNLWPACKPCHRVKTVQEAVERKKINRMKQKNSGAKRSKYSERKQEKPAKGDPFPTLPKARLFRKITG